MINPFTTEDRFWVLNAIAFSTQKRTSVVKGLKGIQNLLIVGPGRGDFVESGDIFPHPS